MKDKLVYKGNNVVGALMSVPICVGTFFVVKDFVVLEDMDGYHDEEMGDVHFGEPFLREVGIKARRFDGMITIYNGSESVTYQMTRSHPRFKHHTNEQCNKIPPLLKEDTAYLCLHSPKTMKETRLIRRIQKKIIRCIQVIEGPGCMFELGSDGVNGEGCWVVVERQENRGEVVL
nr:hypothetical protein [Tanacetum cinerariifolium]